MDADSMTKELVGWVCANDEEEKVVDLVSNPELLFAVGKMVRGNLQQEAIKARAWRGERVTGLNGLDRALAGLGRLLVFAGAKLQEMAVYQNDYQVAD